MKKKKIKRAQTSLTFPEQNSQYENQNVFYRKKEKQMNCIQMYSFRFNSNQTCPMNHWNYEV